MRWKLLTPLADIAEMMPWTGEVPPPFFYFTAVVDLAGGIGVLLPMLTGILSRLTAPAAIGCAALQFCAGAFHASRGEYADTPLNLALFAAAAFVAWGRRSERAHGAARD